MLISALPGADRRQLRATLRDLRDAAMNLRSSGTASDRYSAYLAWVATAVRLLRSPPRTTSTPRSPGSPSPAESAASMA